MNHMYQELSQNSRYCVNSLGMWDEYEMRFLLL